jgi:hypothetical protein
MAKKNGGPWSVLYIADGEIMTIGPYASRRAAEKVIAAGGETDGEFDCDRQAVYLLTPSHELIEYS